jgi:hypothetical protein
MPNIMSIPIEEMDGYIPIFGLFANPANYLEHSFDDELIVIGWSRNPNGSGVRWNFSQRVTENLLDEYNTFNLYAVWGEPPSIPIPPYVQRQTVHFSLHDNHGMFVDAPLQAREVAEGGLGVLPARPTQQANVAAGVQGAVNESTAIFTNWYTDNTFTERLLPQIFINPPPEPPTMPTLPTPDGDEEYEDGEYDDYYYNGDNDIIARTRTNYASLMVWTANNSVVAMMQVDEPTFSMNIPTNDEAIVGDDNTTADEPTDIYTNGYEDYPTQPTNGFVDYPTNGSEDVPSDGSDNEQPTDQPTDLPTDGTEYPYNPSDVPSEPTSPTYPTDEPTNPSEPSQPSEPSDPTSPSEPTDDYEPRVVEAWARFRRSLRFNFDTSARRVGATWHVSSTWRDFSFYTDLQPVSYFNEELQEHGYRYNLYDANFVNNPEMILRPVRIYGFDEDGIENPFDFIDVLVPYVFIGWHTIRQPADFFGMSIEEREALSTFYLFDANGSVEGLSFAGSRADLFAWYRRDVEDTHVVTLHYHNNLQTPTRSFRVPCGAILNEVPHAPSGSHFLGWFEIFGEYGDYDHHMMMWPIEMPPATQLWNLLWQRQNATSTHSIRPWGVTRDITLHAKYAHRVDFDLNGGRISYVRLNDGTAVNNATQKHSVLVLISDIPAYMQPDATFVNPYPAPVSISNRLNEPPNPAPPNSQLQFFGWLSSDTNQRVNFGVNDVYIGDEYDDGDNDLTHNESAVIRKPDNSLAHRNAQLPRFLYYNDEQLPSSTTLIAMYIRVGSTGPGGTRPPTGGGQNPIDRPSFVPPVYRDYITLIYHSNIPNFSEIQNTFRTQRVVYGEPFANINRNPLPEATPARQGHVFNGWRYHRDITITPEISMMDGSFITSTMDEVWFIHETPTDENPWTLARDESNGYMTIYADWLIRYRLEFFVNGVLRQGIDRIEERDGDPIREPNLTNATLNIVNTMPYHRFLGWEYWDGDEREYEIWRPGSTCEYLQFPAITQAIFGDAAAGRTNTPIRLVAMMQPHPTVSFYFNDYSERVHTVFASLTYDVGVNDDNFYTPIFHLPQNRFPANPRRRGYAFGGWRNVETGTIYHNNADITGILGAINPDDIDDNRVQHFEGVVFEAVWLPGVLTVTFNPNTHSDPEALEFDIQTRAANRGDTAVAPSFPYHTCNEDDDYKYIIVAWYKDAPSPDGTRVAMPGYAIEYDITVYALWERVKRDIMFEVIFLDWTGDYITTLEFAPGTILNRSHVQHVVPQRTAQDSRFGNNWLTTFMDVAGDICLNTTFAEGDYWKFGSIAYGSVSNLTITLVASVLHRVSFSANGGTFVPANSGNDLWVLPSQTIELPEVAKLDYNFLGWFDKSSGTEWICETKADDKNFANAVWNPTNLYARWQESTLERITGMTMTIAGQEFVGYIEHKLSGYNTITFTVPANSLVRQNFSDQFKFTHTVSHISTEADTGVVFSIPQYVNNDWGAVFAGGYFPVTQGSLAGFYNGNTIFVGQRVAIGDSFETKVVGHVYEIIINAIIEELVVQLDENTNLYGRIDQHERTIAFCIPHGTLVASPNNMLGSNPANRLVAQSIIATCYLGSTIHPVILHIFGYEHLSFEWLYVERSVGYFGNGQFLRPDRGVINAGFRHGDTVRFAGSNKEYTIVFNDICDC